MATSSELRQLLADVREATDVARQYGGARLWTTGIGFKSIDFVRSSDPDLYWSNHADESFAAGAASAAAEAARSETAQERAFFEQLSRHYASMHGSAAYLVHQRADRPTPVRPLAPRGFALIDPPAESEPEPTAPPGPPREAEGSLPALPPRRRRRRKGDHIRVRVEGAASGGPSGKIVRGN